MLCEVGLEGLSVIGRLDLGEAAFEALEGSAGVVYVLGSGVAQVSDDVRPWRQAERRGTL